MSFRQSLIHSTGWALVGNLSKYLIYFIVLIVLTRLLSPRDFGLMAMVFAFTGFAWQLNELGFGAALVQRKKIDERHRSTIFWLSLLIGIGLTIVLMLSAPLIAYFYGEPQLREIMLVVATYFTIGAGITVQIAILRRELAFRHLALIEMFSHTVGGVFAISLAVAGVGVWSIVSQNLAVMSVRVVVMWLTTSWRPRFIFDMSVIRELMGFSLNLVGIKSLRYWIITADNILIGRFASAYALGIYTRAYAVMLQPLRQITWVVGGVMFSALSRIQDDLPRSKELVLHAQRLIAFLTMPMMLGLMVVADDFVLVLFGEQWRDTIPILRVLCVVAIVLPIVDTNDWVFNAQGRTDVHFRWGIISGVITITAFVIGLNWGVLGVAVAYAIVTYLLLYPNVVIAGRLIGITFQEFILNVLDVLVAAGLMSVFVWSIKRQLLVDLTPVVALLLQTSIGIMAYGFIVLLMKPKAYHDVLKLLSRQPANELAIKDGTTI